MEGHSGASVKVNAQLFEGSVGRVLSKSFIDLDEKMPVKIIYIHFTSMVCEMVYFLTQKVSKSH